MPIPFATHGALRNTNHEIHQTHEMDTNLYLAQSSQRSQRLWSLSKKTSRTKANFARAKKIRTLFYTFYTAKNLIGVSCT